MLLLFFVSWKSGSTGLIINLNLSKTYDYGKHRITTFYPHAIMRFDNFLNKSFSINSYLRSMITAISNKQFNKLSVILCRKE